MIELLQAIELHMAELINIIGFIAGALTTVAFLPQIIKTLRLKEARDISLGLCVFNAAAASSWTAYGALIQSWPLIIPNAIASGLAYIFLFLKLRYKSPVGSGELALLTIALAFMLMGFAAVAFTPLSLIAFVSVAGMVFAPLSFLTQVIKTWRLRETKDISLPMYVIFWSGLVLWLIYGLAIKALPVVANQFAMITLTSIMLFFKLKYR